MELLIALIPIVIVAIIIAILKTGVVSPEKVVGAAVAIIALSYILVPVIYDDFETEQPISLPDTIYYDDYVEVTGEPTVSGVFEYVKYSGIGYVHATDVGTGTIGSTAYTVEPAPLDVFLFIGQSNAANWAGVDANAADPVAERGTSYYFGTKYHQANKNLGVEISDYEMYSTVSLSGDARIGGNDEPFAAEYYNLTGHKSYIINAGIGSTSITTWMPGESSYTYAQELFDAAWDAIDMTHFVPEVKSYIWAQGEADSSMAVATYKTDFLAMHETLIDGTFTTTGSFEYALISITQSENPTTAQEELAETYNTIKIATRLAETFTVDNGYLIGDGLHYSQAGRNLIGVAIAKYYASLT